MANVPRRLPVLTEPPPGEGSLGRDGSRRRPYPADVRGRFLRARRVAYVALIGLWAALPWWNVGGHPAVFLDIARRQFFFFGWALNAQDVWLLFFALTGIGFGLIFATALLGRVWCGWACPQTVFLEAVFRPIERLVNGPRNVALRRKLHPSAARAWRAVVTHVGYGLAAILVAHIVLAYFVSLPRLMHMVQQGPARHPEAFAWSLAMTLLTYANFAFFREQVCVVVCPYGRLQSVLLDDDSLVIGYDRARGEPRRLGVDRAGAGDCVECGRCVAVCPTNIDIREGLQLDCVACTACIDACDEIMVKMGRPRGLVRYDSLRGLRGEARRIRRREVRNRPRCAVEGLVVAWVGLAARRPFEANMLRLVGPPYTIEESTLRNAFEVHLVNKSAQPITLAVGSGGELRSRIHHSRAPCVNGSPQQQENAHVRRHG